MLGSVRWASYLVPSGRSSMMRRRSPTLNKLPKIKQEQKMKRRYMMANRKAPVVATRKRTMTKLFFDPVFPCLLCLALTPPDDIPARPQIPPLLCTHSSIIVLLDFFSLNSCFGTSLTFPAVAFCL